MAPEVAGRENYDYKCDVWSIGVILFEIAFGYPPFYGNSPTDLLKNIHHGEFIVPKTSKICGELMDLLNGCLRIDPKERWTIEEMLDHPFFSLKDDQMNGIEKGDLEYRPNIILRKIYNNRDIYVLSNKGEFVNPYDSMAQLAPQQVEEVKEMPVPVEPVKPEEPVKPAPLDDSAPKMSVDPVQVDKPSQEVDEPEPSTGMTVDPEQSPAEPEEVKVEEPAPVEPKPVEPVVEVPKPESPKVEEAKIPEPEPIAEPEIPEVEPVKEEPKPVIEPVAPKEEIKQEEHVEASYEEIKEHILVDTTPYPVGGLLVDEIIIQTFSGLEEIPQFQTDLKSEIVIIDANYLESLVQ